LFLVLAFSSVTLATSTPFEGVWELKYPFVEETSYLYICQDDTRITGLFNEQTIFIGFPDGDTATGYFYEGYSEGGCTSGEFTFNVDNSSATFYGTIACDDGGSFNWNGTLISTVRPNVVECANIANFDTYTVGGFYIGATNGSANADLCVYDNSEYEGSYTDGSFDAGSAVQEGRILAGIKLTPNQDGALPGSSLIYVDVNGDLHTIWWAGVSTNYTRSPIYLGNSQVHRYDTYSRAKGTSDANCNRNNEIVLADANYYFNPIDFENYYVNPNTSTSLAVPLLFILCALGLIF